MYGMFQGFCKNICDLQFEGYGVWMFDFKVFIFYLVSLVSLSVIALIYT